MLFNRLADWSLDQRNPRTADAPHLISRPVALLLLGLSSAAFVAAAAAINQHHGLLAPVALAIIFFYSLTKRFTVASHFFLGFALAVAPAGAWIAQAAGSTFAALGPWRRSRCWVAGFRSDLCDAGFRVRPPGRIALVGRQPGHSAFSCGSRNGCTSLMLLGVALLRLRGVVGAIYSAAMPLVAGALLYEHRSAARLDLAGINRAFFQSNAFVSAVFLLAFGWRCRRFVL